MKLLRNSMLASGIRVSYRVFKQFIKTSKKCDKSYNQSIKYECYVCLKALSSLLSECCSIPSGLI